MNNLEQLQDYGNREIDALRINNPLFWNWSKEKTAKYVNDHYLSRDQDGPGLRRLLLDMPQGGPIAYCLRGYGHGVGYDFRDVGNVDVINELRRVHALVHPELGIVITWNLFRRIVLHAAAQCDPYRNWLDVEFLGFGLEVQK